MRLSQAFRLLSSLAIVVSTRVFAAEVQMNFHDEFCSTVENACQSGESVRECYANLRLPQKYSKTDPAKLERKLQGYYFKFIRGLGGKEIDPKDYYNETTRGALEDMGVNPDDIEAEASFASSVNSMKQAEGYCREVADLLNRTQKKIVLVGHSRGGRILLMMTYAICPTVMKSPQIEKILLSQPALGGSATANLGEQLDESRWWQAWLKSRKSNLKAAVMSKTAAVIAPDLGYAVDEAYPNLLRREACPACSKKIYSIISSWDDKKCDAQRKKPATDTGAFIAVKEGENDGRLSLKAQGHNLVPQVLARVSCALHSDFFKVKMLPEKKLCQQVFNIWMLDSLFRQ